MNDLAIEAHGLRKSFGTHTALDGLDLRVPAGSIFGFLGRNGAGKTTTIKILTGMLRSDAGAARLFGSPATGGQAGVEIRKRLGVVMEDKELYPYMTVEQIIRFTRPFFPGWREDLERRYVKMFDLPLTRKIPDLSKGMRSKLLLLLAISHRAELLILDEPTDGLDPAATEDILRELVAISASEGTTIFFSSHQLNEVEQIAEHVAIIERGKAIVAGPLDDLKIQYQRLHVVFEQDAPPGIRWLDGVEHVHQEGRIVSILANRNADAITAQAKSIPGASVERFPVTLKEIFLEHVRSN